MNTLIAVTGKGGVGKTTISALIIKGLLESGKKPVLAVDADPNSCLDNALGVTVTSTVGSVREEVRDEASKGLGAGVSKQEMLEIKVAESLVEAEGFDLISMGRPEGAGCYCYANNVLKQVIARLSDAYPYVVLDNEAGLENLSRRIVQKVNIMLLVSDGSVNGLRTLERLYGMLGEMEIGYDKLILIVNRVRGGEPTPEMERIKGATGAHALIVLPDDGEIAELAEKGEALLNVSKDNNVYKKLNAII